jgi:hypothetical protein
MRNLPGLIYLSIKRCRICILSVFLIYCISCFIGILMVHNGNNYALSYRDKIVGDAVKSDRAMANAQKGNNFSAALIDFSNNLFLGAIPQTLMGFSIVIPYISVSKQGWVGGIVSVDHNHKSRFTGFKPAFYYFLVLLLQLIPYSLAIGAGVKCGIDFYKNNIIHGWAIRKYRIQKTSLIDLGYIYVLVVPLFFIASCFEFMSKWNI